MTDQSECREEEAVKDYRVECVRLQVKYEPPEPVYNNPGAADRIVWPGQAAAAGSDAA